MIKSDNTAEGALYRAADFLPHVAALALVIIAAHGLMF